MANLLTPFLFLVLLSFTNLSTASADCGCTTDCGNKLDLSRVKTNQSWMSFMAEVKSCNGASPISGYRSTHCQRQLYNCIKSRGCGTRVGYPGRSPHETGIALDYSSHTPRIRSCMERARSRTIPNSNFGRPHPGQHIDNGGRAANGQATAPQRPQFSSAVEQYQRERKQPARVQRIQKHRKQNRYDEENWQESLWSKISG